MKKEKKKIIITGISLFLFIILIGISYAYFATQTANGANELINIKTGTTDSLTFYVEKDLDIKANQGNFGSTDKTLSDSTYIEANLIANNYTNYAKESYNIYLQIEKNEFHYSTSDEIPELILKITDPENKEYTKMIGNIEYVSNVTDVENIKHSGYDNYEK